MSLLSKTPLPPGHADPVFQTEINSQTYLLEKSRELGPVFARNTRGNFRVFICDLEMANEFIKEFDTDLEPISMEISSMVPNGILRKLGGELHQHYRGVLVKAIRPDILTLAREELFEITDVCLRQYARGVWNEVDAVRSFINTLNNISTAMLLRIVFGIRYPSSNYTELSCRYEKLGPDGLVWVPGEQQHEAFKEISHFLDELIAQEFYSEKKNAPACIIRNIVELGGLDETMSGNLIYMVEMGRFDMAAYFRWIAKFACENPLDVDDLAEQCLSNKFRHDPGIQPFVMETLRMAQSERMLRVASRDLIFKNYLIPRGSIVQICLWESHKSARNFNNPLSFNSARFKDRPFSSKQFSPFGLGQHRCPIGNYALWLASIFVTSMAKHYRIEGVNNGLAFPGQFHWQPSKEFTVRLQSRRPPT